MSNQINLDTVIKIAADSIGQLRRPDVYRVMSEAKQMGVLAEIQEYITNERPDLKAEAESCREDLQAEAGGRA